MRRTFKLVLLLLLHVSVESAKKENTVFLNITCQSLNEKILKYDFCRIRPDNNIDVGFTMRQPKNLFVRKHYFLIMHQNYLLFDSTGWILCAR